MGHNEKRSSINEQEESFHGGVEGVSAQGWHRILRDEEHKLARLWKVLTAGPK